MIYYWLITFLTIRDISKLIFWTKIVFGHLKKKRNIYSTLKINDQIFIYNLEMKYFFLPKTYKNHID